ncbi:MAG: hypothetical protein JRI33_07805 [Deltaproteobacteria bacterium]|nr:hypothetical protein [Deltaproteobacteria bacterium]
MILKKRHGTFLLVVVVIIAMVIAASALPAIAGSVEVSGYTDKGIYVQGELDINQDGSVDGYLYTPKGNSIYVEGEIVRGGSVEIESDSWGGGGYELEVD